jgi:hypothetical protein
MTPDPIMAHLEAAFAREIKRGAIPFTPTTGKRASPLGASVLPLRGPVVGTHPHVSSSLTSASPDHNTERCGFSSEATR